MKLSRVSTGAVSSKDLLIKVLAVAFLNPADRNRQGAKIFIQDFLGCGCPDEVVEAAKLNFFVNPLDMYVRDRITQQQKSLSLTPLEEKVDSLMGLRKTLKWPRKASGELIPPASWRRPMLQAVAKRPKEQEILAGLRHMCKVTIDAVIEVPARAFFFLVTLDSRKAPRTELVLQYDSGQLLYKLLGYNRCRLFTISNTEGPKVIQQIDTALTWQGLYDAFLQRRGEYPFARPILDLFVT
jgi:hypothetical protein